MYRFFGSGWNCFYICLILCLDVLRRYKFKISSWFHPKLETLGGIKTKKKKLLPHITHAASLCFWHFFLQCNWNTLTAIVWMQTYLYVGWWKTSDETSRKEKKNISGSFCSTCERNVTLIWQRCQFIHLIHGRATWRSLFRVPPVKLPICSIAQ